MTTRKKSLTSRWRSRTWRMRRSLALKTSSNSLSEVRRVSELLIDWL
jgi:hypothetical protein